jgi:predicted transposase YbfD/YdcC
MPHHSTLRRLLQKLSLLGLREQAPAFLVARLSPEKRLYHQDGQALRGTIAGEETDGRHWLAIQQAGTNLVLAQIPAVEKMNEISAASKLLKTVDLSDKIVSGDAMHSQRNLSRQIVESGRTICGSSSAINRPYGTSWARRSALQTQVPPTASRGRNTTRDTTFGSAPTHD